MLAPLHDDATIDEAVAALAREPGGYLIAADEGLGSLPLEVRVTRRWRKQDSNLGSRATQGAPGILATSFTRSNNRADLGSLSARGSAVRTDSAHVR